MPQLATDLIELGVGLACLLAAAGLWRRRMRAGAVVLVVAGGAAVVHAVWSMVTR